MRIMSLLFTVAIVSVVCAIEGADPNRVTAPKRAPRTCFTVTSLGPFALSICSRIAIMFTPDCNVVKAEIGSLHRVADSKRRAEIGRERRGQPPPPDRSRLRLHRLTAASVWRLP